ncbi:TIGR03617 family F420-dependent LLM class oxidoreductase (plasmid) [Rhodococcus opacus]|uniref:TIGR03617 family F420-dependent LLM class oxidoreductase n=1 Tax=Rhodococcus TaxID=1827 RepID=UPI000BB0CCC0|nr:TIGR03617 family F420-dependent LLM class oxidoreductase [Rhodococcus sp. ACPA1]PBC47657.1 LLM class F420-dependent oxidoreductase [Rhodococcus sp. ACPA1]WKN61041.1 TIGR03617 family F420-dependent LLM class oxidoreductase [Rhodococcus opacus]
MKVDARLDVDDVEAMAQTVRRLEMEGYAGIWTSETAHDPFLPLMIAAQQTQRVQLGCAIAVAFARNPMTIANVAHDLQRYSRGRFALGLGTQVKSHIERRFSMQWSDPMNRLEEFIDAVRAILTAWETGERLHFEGSYYRHTLMTPMFRPDPHGHGLPPIIMAGVGASMVEAAARSADGVLVHAFSTPDYLREVVLPAVERGLSSRARARDGFEVSCRGFLATGRDEKELDCAKQAIRARIAFYASTPSYMPVLERHGWEALGRQLNTLSRSGDDDRWTKMASLIDDEVLETFAIVAEPDRAGAEIVRRYSVIADRYWFYTPYPIPSELLSSISRAISTGQSVG